MTQLEYAKKGIITDQMRKAAEYDGVTPEFIMEGIKEGTIVLPYNINRGFEKIRAIGKGLSIKVNANIGSSPMHISVDEEIEKLKIAEKYGADSVMDLSLGVLLKDIRKRVLEESNVMIGTVPIYEVGFDVSKSGRLLHEMTIDDFLRVIEQQGREGVDFMTIHAGVTLSSLERMEKEGRVLNVVSRGGSMMIVWMKKNNKESFLYTHFDEILDILKEYDITLSLGDGMRPGAIADATDRAQIEELIILGELAQRAWEKGVQVMIEGPGHVPLNEIEENIKMEKSFCHGAPFYVLGPLPTDRAAGYDHIAGAVGGALAGYFGADFLCYVTPSEHLRLPTVDDVREGVIASRIAADIADIARGRKRNIELSREMAEARHKLDWNKQMELAIDSEKAKKLRDESEATEEEYCTMCGEFCAIKQVNDALSPNKPSE